MARMEAMIQQLVGAPLAYANGGARNHPGVEPPPLEPPEIDITLLTVMMTQMCESLPINYLAMPLIKCWNVEDHVTAAHIQDTGDDLQDEDQDIDQAATVTKPMITTTTINPP
uniref:Uncharacterized protein n=1 Tax=Salix viminalis TaxID=40686 RepID=A0A6N2LJ79_SALVM